VSVAVQFLPAVLIGLVTGLISGTFGIGGGVLCTPLTRLFLNISPHVAVGTTLVLIIPTAISGAVNYWRQDMVALNLVRTCALPAIVGTIFGSAATIFINGHVLMLLVSAIIGLSGLDFLTGFGKRFQQHMPNFDLTEGVLPPQALKAARILGLVVGMASGLLGVGGGFILIPGFCYLFGTPIKMAFGSSLVLVALIAVPGTVVHFFAGHVNLLLALLMIVGALPGAWLGSFAAVRIKDSWLKAGFGLVLCLMALFFGVREVQLMLTHN